MLNPSTNGAFIHGLSYSGKEMSGNLCPFEPECQPYLLALKDS